MSATVAARIEAVTSSAQHLRRGLEGLTDQQCRGPSLLPEWSRGHVLTHLARNADALSNLAHWARTGEETPMYPSREARSDGIEAGAGRPVDELLDDLEDSSARLLGGMESLTAEEWRRPIRWGFAGHESEASEIPLLRRTEIEVHHVDLDLDYTAAHWPEDFVEDLLTEAAADFSARGTLPGFVLVGNDDEGRWTIGAGGLEIFGPPPALLGWLLGRTDGTGLHTDDVLPPLEVWR